MPIKKPKTSYAEARSMSMAQRDRGIGIATPPASMDNAPTHPTLPSRTLRPKTRRRQTSWRRRHHATIPSPMLAALTP